MALALFALAAAMIRYPEILPVNSEDLSRHHTRGWVTIIELLWSRPVGIVLGLLGLLVIVGSLTKRSADHSTVA